MTSATATPFADALKRRVTTGPGAPGRLVIGSTLAGGLIMGGFLVALSTLVDELAVTAGPEVTRLAFAAGLLLGLVHGSVLGVLGRPDDMSRREAMASALAGAMWAVPLALIAFYLTLWLSVTRWAFVVAQPFLIAGVLLSWIFGLAIVLWFGRELGRAVRFAVRRWPERRSGGAIIALTFVALLVALVALRPEIWWTDERVSAAGAVLLAFGITVWAAIPLEVLALRLIRHRA